MTIIINLVEKEEYFDYSMKERKCIILFKRRKRVTVKEEGAGCGWPTLFKFSFNLIFMRLLPP